MNWVAWIPFTVIMVFWLLIFGSWFFIIVRAHTKWTEGKVKDLEQRLLELENNETKKKRESYPPYDKRSPDYAWHDAIYDRMKEDKKKI